ncbi:Kinesin-like protein kif19 [Homalodisca vitripennis]|nr:Kinesin-like protein kif19 [Homalodisca vitripennis]
MDIDGHLLSLGVEAERQHQIISQWESRSNKLYHRKSRPGTDQSETNGNIQDPWNEVNMHQAWSELSYIEREQERYMALRSATLRELEQCRQRAVQLENDLPSRLDSDTERELLSLLCRVHELEADKMALQGERLVETHELRRRGELIQKYNRQQKITDDIITRQRQIMEAMTVKKRTDEESENEELLVNAETGSETVPIREKVEQSPLNVVQVHLVGNVDIVEESVVRGVGSSDSLQTDDYVRKDLLTRWKRGPIVRANVRAARVNILRQLPGTIDEEVKVVLPNDLQDLYNLYQQEIHATTINPGFDSLPPINRE